MLTEELKFVTVCKFQVWNTLLDFHETLCESYITEGNNTSHFLIFYIT